MEVARGNSNVHSSLDKPHDADDDDDDDNGGGAVDNGAAHN